MRFATQWEELLGKTVKDVHRDNQGRIALGFDYLEVRIKSEDPCIGVDMYLFGQEFHGSPLDLQWIVGKEVSGVVIRTFLSRPIDHVGWSELLFSDGSHISFVSEDHGVQVGLSS